MQYNEVRQSWACLKIFFKKRVGEFDDQSFNSSGKEKSEANDNLILSMCALDLNRSGGI